MTEHLSKSTQENEFLESLNDFLDTELENELNIDYEAVANNQFQITNRDQANYFIKLIKENQNEIDKINELAERETQKHKDRIEDWRKRTISSYEGSNNYFKMLLERFAAEEMGEAKKTIKLPYGSLAYRKVADTYDYDEEQLINQYADNENFVKIEKKLHWAELKKNLNIIDDKVFCDGQQLDIQVIHHEPKFEVK